MRRTHQAALRANIEPLAKDRRALGVVREGKALLPLFLAANGISASPTFGVAEIAGTHQEIQVGGVDGHRRLTVGAFQGVVARHCDRAGLTRESRCNLWWWPGGITGTG